MIKAGSNLVVGRVINRQTCSTVVVTNYEKCSAGLLNYISKHSFVVNTTQHYPDLVCVVAAKNMDELVSMLCRESIYCKIEQE
jgi:hypothetical protein